MEFKVYKGKDLMGTAIVWALSEPMKIVVHFYDSPRTNHTFTLDEFNKYSKRKKLRLV
jgi:hypothetical protein